MKKNIPSQYLRRHVFILKKNGKNYKWNDSLCKQPLKSSCWVTVRSHKPVETTSSHRTVDLLCVDRFQSSWYRPPTCCYAWDAWPKRSSRDSACQAKRNGSGFALTRKPRKWATDCSTEGKGHPQHLCCGQGVPAADPWQRIQEPRQLPGIDDIPDEESPASWCEVGAVLLWDVARGCPEQTW